MSEGRTAAEIIAIAAWVNCDPRKLPEGMKSHTCEATMIAWRRVAHALIEYATFSQDHEKEIRRICGALKSAKDAHPSIDYAGFETSIAKRILGEVRNIPQNAPQTSDGNQTASMVYGQPK